MKTKNLFCVLSVTLYELHCAATFQKQALTGETYSRRPLLFVNSLTCVMGSCALSVKYMKLCKCFFNKYVGQQFITMLLSIRLGSQSSRHIKTCITAVLV